MKVLTTGQVAKRLKVRPSEITSLFYQGKLRDDLCPVESGRRLIPESYIEEIARGLRRAGKLAPLDSQGVGHE